MNLIIAVDFLTQALMALRSLAIQLKHSKTDQFGRRITIFLARTRASLCPVSALLDYLDKWGTRSGPLFLFEMGNHCHGPS